MRTVLPLPRTRANERADRQKLAYRAEIQRGVDSDKPQQCQRLLAHAQCTPWRLIPTSSCVCVCVRARACVYSVSVSVCPRISSWCRLGFDDNNGKPDVRHFVQQSLDARESKIVRGTPAWLPRADGTCAAEVEVSAEVCLALLQGGVAFFVGYRHFFALRYLSHGHDE